jgi:hypothetical protein
MKYYKVKNTIGSCLIGYLLCGHLLYQDGPDEIISLQFATYTALQDFKRRWGNVPGCCDTWEKYRRFLIEVEI